ncbi:MAG: system NifU family Fe-S cluster assembly protein, partial [Dehalococcoidia bacterium]|nr:system NifU family Fe-S cluster assembly protein [Dehalococcoidia bacterium]
CGDRVELYLVIENGAIVDVVFQGNGCAISQASASMMTDSVKGKSLDEAMALAASFREFMTKPDAVFQSNDSPDLEALEGVKNFPVRVKCATLSWNTLQEAVETFRTDRKEGTRLEKDS